MSQYCIGHTLKKSLFICDSKVTGHFVFYLATLHVYHFQLLIPYHRNYLKNTQRVSTFRNEDSQKVFCPWKSIKQRFPSLQMLSVERHVTWQRDN